MTQTMSRLFLVLAVCVALAAATPLDDYVKRPEPLFEWHDTGARVGNATSGFIGYVLNFTSQQWLTAADSSQPIWTHQLVVIVPTNYDPTSTALLYIGGGENPGQPIKPLDEEVLVVAILAQKTKCAAGVLFQIPNQRISFPTDPTGPNNRRGEDSLIAMTWWHFINNPTDEQAEWILELPMTKSAVKAMDVLQAAMPAYTNHASPQQFVVLGASKRGWTTWLTAAVDSRVTAAVPIVLDALDMRGFLHRQYTAYNGFSFALQPYVELNITQNIDSEAAIRMFEIIDPISYASRLTMPKMMVTAGGDEFQMPDDQRYWHQKMVGEMNFLVIKNAEHSEATGMLELIPAVSSFVQQVVAHKPRPTMVWKIDDVTGNISVLTDTVPKKVTIAVADSAGDVSTGKRDFRWAALNVSFCPIKVFGGCVRPVFWSTQPLQPATPDQLSYVASVPLPAAGKWRAFMVEMTWAGLPGGDDLTLTSGVSVIPDTWPFADCTTPQQCHGVLV